ncbi:hypothetical protein ASPSYDRAFT_1056664 [Aspergillus sydowii CBS 593.65]|uniref:Uncharacterized protein n=1 Tax=Aspergillus sydowii CBS 593.65 TaxID=1036612 RepID=A0A1L9TDI1_9EURO|nr:uncharacterized protein ASPSYDRAFT_1056664 [Aspergillus sydowii CBS 593.65]OJJ57489.1 hypothetical protein ASPSYDRAFT_1056664 [Aspergillus sydowii CBS 593.65]
MNPIYKGPQPIPASTASRSKLDSFRYRSDNENGTKGPIMKTSPQKGHTNKENQASWVNGVLEQEESKQNDQQQSQGIAESKTIKDCPQTPGNRLPLADLIGNAEDAFSRAPVGQEFTPEDYVIWQHAPPSSNPSTQTPATQSKKRRHSESPSSSPLAGSKGARKGSFDMQSFQALLKTPQNDLAAELWNNYVAKTGTHVPDIQQPRFANLLSSSPHTPGSARTGQDSSGLRRSISCNAEWPSSTAKRRKIEEASHPTKKGRTIFSRSRSNVMVPKDLKTSNFSSLVKAMERSLKKSPSEKAGAPKSTPTTLHNKTRRSRSASPLETKITKPAVRGPNMDEDMVDAPGAPTNKKPLQESSSDFGDDDLDDEFLGLAEASMDPFVESTGIVDTKGVLGTTYGQSLSSSRDSQSSDKKDHDLRGQSDKESSHSTDYQLDVDEFDDDFEGFGDNIDEILAGCDQTPSYKGPGAIPQHSSVPKHPLPHGRTEMPVEIANGLQNEAKEQFTTSSDEFDNDEFDMDCFDQPVPQVFYK